MSNPTPPVTPNYQTPPPSGGMPKWLIILLAVFLFFILGCCGFWAACNFMCAKVGQGVGAAAQAAAEAATQRAQQAIIAEQQRIAAEQAARGGVAAPEPGDAGAGGGAAGGGGNAGGGSPAAPIVPIARMPANFPKDIPLMPGLTATNSLSDNATGAGWVQFRGNAKLQDVVDYYEKQMKSKGYTLGTNLDTGDTSVRGFTKDTQQVTITMNSEGSATNAVIVYETKK